MHKPIIHTPAPEAYDGNTHIKERSLAFVDLEFSGLGAPHEILEIGLLLVQQPGFEILRQWETKVQPTDIGNADPISLRMGGYTPEAWKDALPLREALTQFDALVADTVLIGFNVVGDFYQLKKSYHAAGLTPSYHWQVLDVQSMVFAAEYGSKLSGFRMREVVPFYQLQDREWHNALADATATYDVFKALMERQRADER
jgi:DNA polymerase III epsilon subunit-like protein